MRLKLGGLGLYSLALDINEDRSKSNRLALVLRGIRLPGKESRFVYVCPTQTKLHLSHLVRYYWINVNCSDKRDTIIVKLAGDLFAELKLERAEIFITEKLDVRILSSTVCSEDATRAPKRLKFT